ncbi:hypothetical protein C2G38_2244894 [Gigaspora rosea]|uniref:Uncharacterized protein n=1 Tax=Gigaspora rosea TaxID=44941 RepID=A0A397VBN3_9GLOM|nr:hypothetical protein C2G38_2244894 [Gigaspora rosea]
MLFSLPNITFSNTNIELLNLMRMIYQFTAELGMFSRWSKYVRGDGVDEVVQYGFAQLDRIGGPTDLAIFEKDAITVRIAEPQSNSRQRTDLVALPPIEAPILEEMITETEVTHHNFNLLGQLDTTVVDVTWNEKKQPNSRQRIDLVALPPIEAPILEEMATGFYGYRPQ